MAYPASKRRAAAAGLLDDDEDGVAESVLFPVQPTKAKREAILSPYERTLQMMREGARALTERQRLSASSMPAAPATASVSGAADDSHGGGLPCAVCLGSAKAAAVGCCTYCESPACTAHTWACGNCRSLLCNLCGSSNFSGKDERLCCPACQHCTEVGDGHSLDAIQRSAERLRSGALAVAGGRVSAALIGRGGESAADSGMVMDEAGASMSGLDGVSAAPGQLVSGLMDADAAVAGAGCSAGKPSQERRGPLDAYFALRR